jgi:hypothetical protein
MMKILPEQNLCMKKNETTHIRPENKSKLTNYHEPKDTE